GADLVVIDPVAWLRPGVVEYNPTSPLRALEPLRLLNSPGKSVLLLHHPKKSGPARELSPRGSGALVGFVDLVVNLTVPDGLTELDRRRRLRSASRLHESTDVLLELSADGLDYRTVAEPPPESFDQIWN